MIGLRSIARALGGTISGRSVLFPGPGHSRKDRSASLILSPGAPDGFLVFSHCGDDPLQLKDYVRERLGLSRAVERRTERGAHSQREQGRSDDAERTARALAIWREAQP